MAVNDEWTFGTAIVSSMCANGWSHVESSRYDRQLAFIPDELFAFITATQAKAWLDIVAVAGDESKARADFMRRLDAELQSKGLPEVLRSGVKDRGQLIQLAYFKPELIDSDETLANYRTNRLAVVRELRYGTKLGNDKDEIDLALFLNGIPVATAELKNEFTHQNVEHAKQQYREKRDHREAIFTRRVVANFAVDQDLVFVAAQLRGKQTQFLPFNTGSHGPGASGGKGNPPSRPGEYATSFLWEEVWAPDNWLEMLERFVHVVKPKRGNGRAQKTTIFPRFHQWHAVRKLTDHARSHGSGYNYLIMHSAGSGKSNTIAWLAYRLASLHAPLDPSALDPEAIEAGVKPGEPVYDKVLIITDRRNLDRQLQDTIGSFERVKGLVRSITGEGGSKSAQLARELSSRSGKIVIVTLQTFPALIDFLKQNPTEIKGSRFAIIVDEAHSSQSGDAAAAVRKTLRDLGLDADDEDEGSLETAAPFDLNSRLRAEAAARGKSPNLSYFAFTATPKAKTLEEFGSKATVGGQAKYVPFHTYSMRQAIEEGFILDPLRNYTSYKAYYELATRMADDPRVDKKKADRILVETAVLDPVAVMQHAKVIVEHFRHHTLSKLGGRAKAMVVTGSRREAVMMVRAIRSYAADRVVDDPAYGFESLVAFSGSLKMDGVETTEADENGGLPEGMLPEVFAYTRVDDETAKRGGRPQIEYRILVVADKYQTGFDQPLLSTMYVKKKLHGISAVQTLSRLNRISPFKDQDDLAVLDFVNKPLEIQESFRPFYEAAETLPTDPNMLYEVERRLMEAEILVRDEMRAFAEAYFDAQDQAGGDQAAWVHLHADLYHHTEAAKDRFTALLDSGNEEDEEAAEQFRFDLRDFLRKYGFLSTVMPYEDEDLQALYLFGKHLVTRLPRKEDGGIDLGEIDLAYMRIDLKGENDLSLAPEGTAELKGFGDGTGRAVSEEEHPLSEVVRAFNERYGTEFAEEDAVKPFDETMKDKRVRLAGVANDSEEQFGQVFDKVFDEKMEEHVSRTAELGRKYFQNKDGFKSTLDRKARSAAWRILREREGLDS